MTPEEIGKRIKDKFGDAVVDVVLATHQAWAQVKPDQIVEVARFCRDDSELRFDFLRSLASVDYQAELEIVYILFSYPHRHEFKLKVRVPRDNPVLPTVETIWPAANWHEREAYDLMGIEFKGHSDLRRIMLPDDWEGHPLRKDYKEKDSYHGVSTTRDYLTGMPLLPTHPQPPKADGDHSA